jgi:uncharacterized protein
MAQPDFENARRYALERLEHNLSPAYLYHSLAHTRDEVAPAVERLASLEHVAEDALLLLRTAAYYHDIGLVRQRASHEAAGVQIAAVTLPSFGYSRAQIRLISGMIMATQLPQNPRNHLEQLLADADLDVLGRLDFLPRNQALRAEMTAFGATTSDMQWYRQQLHFMRTHHYWTAAARALRDAQKRHNCAALQRLIEESQLRGG